MNNNASVKTYSLGFGLSIALTFAAYFAVVNHVISGTVLIGVILGLALLQLTVQLIFFLHLWEEAKPRWNLVFFLCTFSLVLLVVVASIWIMNHLNYNMTPSEMNSIIIKDEGMHY